MSKKEAFLSSLACLFIGIVVGFLIAPIKRGIYCGNNNGDSFGENDDCDEYFNDDCYADDEDDLIF